MPPSNPRTSQDIALQTSPDTCEWPVGWMPVGMGERAGPVHALMSARAGGVSEGPYACCNLGDHVGDVPEAVAHNRSVFAARMQARPLWLTQVHGNRVVRLRHGQQPAGADDVLVHDAHQEIIQARADGALTTEPGLACVVMVADCLPVLLAAPNGRGVAALHAGWRGLAGAGDMHGRGIVHTGIEALCEATATDPADLAVWLGPCIGPAQFEVGPEVLQGFGVDPASSWRHQRFVPNGVSNGAPRWLADLPGLARDILATLGVHDVRGGQWCTVTQADRYYSFRRDGVTGRQAAAISIQAR
jgi:YfiH family protein